MPSLLKPTRSLAVAILGALVLTTTALAQTPGPLSECAGFDRTMARMSMEPVGIAVIGSVQQSTTGQTAVVAPEAYLKGPTSAETVRLQLDTLPAECAAGALPVGERVLLLLRSNRGDVHWPSTEQVWVLRGGQATLQATGESVAESELVGEIRGVTGQYSVPVAVESEAPGIDWIRTVLWVGGVVLVVFVIGLVLMKEWHRIDPT